MRIQNLFFIFCLFNSCLKAMEIKSNKKNTTNSAKLKKIGKIPSCTTLPSEMSEKSKAEEKHRLLQRTQSCPGRVLEKSKSRSLWSPVLKFSVQLEKKNKELVSEEQQCLNAIRKKDKDKFNQLLNSISDINYQDPDTGNTLLMEAVIQLCKAKKKSEKKRKDHPAARIFYELMKQTNLNHEIRNNEGKRAVDIAKNSGIDLLVRTLNISSDLDHGGKEATKILEEENESFSQYYTD